MSITVTRRMTLRVYRVRADGSKITDLSMTTVRDNDKLDPLTSSAWPPCTCARCRAAA